MEIYIYIDIIFLAMIFISVLLDLVDFSDILILCSLPNSCCQQNLKCFDVPLLSQACFNERESINVTQI